MGSAAVVNGAVEWGGHGSGTIEWMAVGGHSSGGSVAAIIAAGGVGGCPVGVLTAAVVGAAAADDEVVVVVEGVVAVAPLRLPLVELPQPEEPGWVVVLVSVRLILRQVVQADVA